MKVGNCNPKISVIMGVYNSEQTLPDAIESIINQVYSDWELIVCDDASTDNSFAIIKEYSSKYPNILTVQNEKRHHLAYSLNRCLEFAKGEYIARMDADDESLKERFSKQVEFLDSHPEYDLVSSRAIVFDENGVRGIRGLIGEPKKYEIFSRVLFMHPTIMARRNVYDVLKGYTDSRDTLCAEDYDFWIRFVAAGFRGYRHEDILYKYRESIQSLYQRDIKIQYIFLINQLKCFRLLKAPPQYTVFLLRTCISMVVPPKLKYLRRNLKEKKEDGERKK